MILREPAIGLPALCLSAALLAGCAAVPAEDRPSSIPRIILDTDVGSSTDDLFALAMLYRYEGQGRCRLLGDAAWNAAMLERIRALVRMH